MFCMLMHLLHDGHGDHAPDAGHNVTNVTTHSPAPAGERELAELRAEVRWLRALVSRSTPENAGEAAPHVGAAGGAHYGRH